MDRKAKDSSTFSVMSQVCSAFFERLDRKSLVTRILDAAIETTTGDRGTIFLAPRDLSTDASEGELSSLIATGLEGREIHVSINEGVAGYVFRTNLPYLTNDAQNSSRFYPKVDETTGYTTQSILSVPMRTPSGRTLGVIEILNSKNGQFSEVDMQVLQVLSLFAAVALEYRDTIDTLNETTENLRQGRSNWVRQVENYNLKSTEPALQELYDKIPAYATSDSNLLIEGESGTGKEVVAQSVHVKSKRREKPFIAVNCAAIPDTLFEAEFFGVARGAATGTSARKGKVELAHGGTLFLDEIGELPLAMQAKLLRVLQEKTIIRLGSEDKPKTVDFRLIAATNKNLAQLVREGKFREDLFYRINVIHFKLFPLRDRTGDIAPLSTEILKRFGTERGWRDKTLSDAALATLTAYSWPGNIRELQNKLESAVIQSGERKELSPTDFQTDFTNLEAAPVSGSGGSKGEMAKVIDLRTAKEILEKDLIHRALGQTKGNKSQAARLLGITREGLRKAMKKAA